MSITTHTEELPQELKHWNWEAIADITGGKPKEKIATLFATAHAVGRATQKKELLEKVELYFGSRGFDDKRLDIRDDITKLLTEEKV